MPLATNRQIISTLIPNPRARASTRCRFIVCLLRPVCSLCDSTEAAARSAFARQRGRVFVSSSLTSCFTVWVLQSDNGPSTMCVDHLRRVCERMECLGLWCSGTKRTRCGESTADGGPLARKGRENSRPQEQTGAWGWSKTVPGGRATAKPNKPAKTTGRQMRNEVACPRSTCHRGTVMRLCTLRRL